MDGGRTWSIAEADKPGAGDVAVLEHRRTALLSFPPSPADKRETMISRLFLRYPFGNQRPAEQVRAYAQDLARFPLWAISKGIAEIIAGHAIKPGKEPTSPEVQAAVQAQMQPVLEEVALIGHVLGAKAFAVAPLSVDARKAIADAARQSIRTGAPERAPPRVRDMRLASKFDDARAPQQRAEDAA